MAKIVLHPDWLTATNPDVLLNIVRPPAVWPARQETPPPATTRRLLLFEVACARMVWEFLPTDARSGVLVRERFADDRATEADLRASVVRVTGSPITYLQHAMHAAAGSPRSAAAALAGRAAGPAPADYHKRERWHSVWNRAFAAARAHQAELVRDIFPPPGYGPVLRPDWRTSTVVAVARQMDETGDFSGVPILADALQDAGCDDEVMLERCRAVSGIHCRGNWVVDLVLGRE